MTRPPSGIASFDSASAMVRAVARMLRRQDFPALGQPRILEKIVPLADHLPPHLREWVFAVAGGLEAVPSDATGRVDAAAIAGWMAGLYPRRPYPAIMIGSSSGALVHLCAALGTPWLPQTFLTPVRQRGVRPDDAWAGVRAAQDSAARLLAANPDVQLHHMQDPNQDRLMLSVMTYFRLKFRRLPPAYRDFITRWLEPGGIIFITDCRRRWPTTRLGERYLYQFGALGGATPEEYLHGSERVADYLRRYRVPCRRWHPPPPDGDSPEAEWGFEPALGEDVERLARERRYRVVRIPFDEPEHLSPLVADLYRWWYRRRGLSGNRLLVESFILLEPFWALRTGSVPFWMKFNKEPSLDWLRRYLARAEPFDYIHLMLFPHGVESVGLPGIEQWREILRAARRTGSFLGVNEAAYPRHFSALARYHTEMRAIPPRYPVPGPLTLRQFEAFLSQAGAACSGRFPGFSA